jgi:phospholipase C
MDGFIAAAEAAKRKCAFPEDPNCTGAARVDVMGYHDAREIPNYWRYASDFVLQDHMFEPNASWSLPAHLFMVSEWSARCSSSDPMSCRNALDAPLSVDPRLPLQPTPDYAWTDLTYLLYRQHVSWKYYVEDGTQPDCADGDLPCVPQGQSPTTPEIWNPLPYFETVKNDNQLGNIQGLESFYSDVQNNRLPAVSWIVPSFAQSEHAPALVSDGQAHVTKVINQIMQSPAWSSTAILLAWDDWGGLYDHVVPPKVDLNGYGLRVPGLVVSPFAKRGYIDHQTLSFDAYVRFIEDVFLGGQRLDPATDGRPDPRPTVREQVQILGDVSSEFDFNQQPLGPELLQLFPAPGPPSVG